MNSSIAFLTARAKSDGAALKQLINPRNVRDHCLACAAATKRLLLDQRTGPAASIGGTFAGDAHRHLPQDEVQLGFNSASDMVRALTRVPGVYVVLENYPGKPEGHYFVVHVKPDRSCLVYDGQAGFIGTVEEAQRSRGRYLRPENFSHSAWVPFRLAGRYHR